MDSAETQPAFSALPLASAIEAQRAQVTQFGLPDDRFTLGRNLSNGGQGDVHVCTRNSSGEEFAVKVINRRQLQEHSRNEVLLRREIRTLREIQHPNVVSLHDAFWEGGSCFIVMDLAEEGDLREKITYHVGIGPDPPSCERAAMYIVRQLIKGLNCMHQRRVLHRDLKAENILVTRQSRAEGAPHCWLYDVRITDFGLSTWLDITGEAMTPCGTPNYLAPEVMKENYDERIDFWSLGVVNYMMLCGDFPFEMYYNPADMERAVRKDIIVTEAYSLVSEEAKGFTRALLEYDATKRLSHGACFRHPWMLQGRDVAENLAWANLEVLEVGTPHDSDGEASASGSLAGAVSAMSGWTGAAVDCVKLQSRDGVTHTLGTSNGGWAKSNYGLEPDEIIMAVAQETRCEAGGTLGNALTFYTSHGQVICFQGEDARHRGRFAAPFGHQVVGLQFVGSNLVGIHIKDVPDNGRGDVESIAGRVGYAVDEVRLQLRNGKSRRYGGRGGYEQTPVCLEPNEVITVVEQAYRNEYLGNSIAFYTSAGRVYRLSGMEASSSKRYVAPSGEQVCGIDIEDGQLTRVKVCHQGVGAPTPDQIVVREAGG